MILTYKVKHNRDFREELKKARQIANFAISNRDKLSTKYISCIGLKSVISNAILYKYGRNRKCKRINKITLPIPGQGVKRIDNSILYISSLKLKLLLDKDYIKVNQLELDEIYAYINVTVPELEVFKPQSVIGIDRNTTGHIVCAAVLETGKVHKLGKSAQHIRLKYKEIRKNFQKKGKFSILRKIKGRERNILKDINHKTSRYLVNLASKLKGRLVMEDLEGIRKNKKVAKSFKYALNSWSYYQLQQFIEYKAKLAGVTIDYIDPYHTSKCCSRCGLVGDRQKKKFKCLDCGHVEHADANAAFNIANVSKGVFDFQKKEILKKGVPVPL